MDAEFNLLEELPCGMLEFTPLGKIVVVNQFLCRVLGYSREEILARSFDDILTVSSRIFHQTHFLPLLRLHGETREIYLTLRAKDESAVPMLTNARGRAGDGTANIVCAFMPVPERAKYEEKLLAARKTAEEAFQSNAELQSSRAELRARLVELDRQLAAVDRRNRELLRFNEILSHELSEPLRKIGAFADLLASECVGKLESQGRHAMDRLNAACGQMADLLKILKDYLWIDSDPEDASMVKLNEVVAEAALGLGKTVEVSTEDLPMMHGYPRQLTALFNLLFHSAAARKFESVVRVRITAARIEENSFRKLAGKYNYVEAVQICMEDDGIGFATEDGESFFRLIRKAQTPAPHPDLAICKKVVDNHGGEISLRSPAGRGAVFTITLPLQAVGGGTQEREK